MIIDIECIVEEATDVVYLDIIVGVENDDSRDAEDRAIARFLAKGCICSLTGGSPCHTTFTASQLQAAHDECRQLTHDDLDLIVMGHLRALCPERSCDSEDQGKEH